MIFTLGFMLTHDVVKGVFPECKYEETPFAQVRPFREESLDLGIPRTKPWHCVVILARLHHFQEELDESSRVDSENKAVASC